jgi:lipid-binding SYLF domain-containing protein
MTALFRLSRLMTMVATLAVTLAMTGAAPASPTSTDLDRDAQQALEKLYRNEPLAERLSRDAKGILVFPEIVKAGLVIGGSYGKGVLLRKGKVNRYYNSVAGSWGLQAGAQSYGYALFLMNDKAVNYLDRSDGWEIGVGPTVVVVDKGVAKNLSTTTLKDDAYAFIFDQQGLMAGIALEGSKISRIEP